ncbi:protein Wiz [Salminus brasiliensis]|uniref:protein Wiz n=1 Tax=Salminus brasiliensis TaxID=930266 RepID=UPI003B834AD5
MERAPETARKSTCSPPSSLVQPQSPPEDPETGVHLCEVCGGCFETKRGLSSHCRSHLRQLGVSVSDSSGAPIDLLYQLIRERDGKLPFSSGQDSTDKTPIRKKPKTPKSPQTASPKTLSTTQTPTPKTLNLLQTPTPKTLNLLQTPTPKTLNLLQTPTPKSHKPRKTPKTLSSKKTTKLKIKISTLVKKKYSKSPAPSLASLTPSSSPSLLSPLKPAKPRKVPTEPKKGSVSVSPPSSLSLASSKPLWAPQETDAPLDLMAMSDPTLRDDVHVCELCGAWYETRKGLSSHARAHLRQFGVEMDSKGAPIDILHELLQKEEQQGGGVSPVHIEDLEVYSPSCTSSGPAPKRPPPSSPPSDGLHSAPVSSPPLKKLKTSLLGAGLWGGPFEVKAQRKGDSVKDVSCEFCHEKFKKSQSLASHARSHLRQLGITDWTVHGSPMAALRDLMASRGVTSLPKPHAHTLKHGVTPTKTLSPKSLSSPTKPQAPPCGPPTLSHTLPSKPLSPPTTPLVVATKPSSPPTKTLMSAAPPPKPTASLPPFATPFHLSPSSTPAALFPGSAPPRVPKARKGSRAVFPKPKDEPVELDITIIEPPKPKTAPGSSSGQANTVLKAEVVPLRCEYCTDMFDTRKALSCHARAHLRQLGVKWSPNASPIDTLHELMVREGTFQGSELKLEPSVGTVGLWRKVAPSPQMATPSPVDFLREKSDSLDGTATGFEATCELCGFDFENRKALASHARAHLRQQGVDWHTNGSPIETLAEWMQREPGKVAELHRRYMRGDLPQVVKRRSSSSPYPSHSDLDRPAPAREVKGHPSTSSAHRKPSTLQHTPVHTASRGCERRPPKHLPNADGRLGTGPLKPRVGNAPSLMPRPPASSLVKVVGKVYSLKCRFCEEVFKGPLSVQEDWLIHLRQHILNLRKDSAPNPAPNPAPVAQSSTPTRTDTVQLIGPQAV